MRSKTLFIGRVPFSRLFCASGTRNNYGEGYWFHKPQNLSLILFPWLWFSWRDTTLVTKTTVFPANEGEMPLNKWYQPKEWFPRCIFINFWRGFSVNAVSLSTPGLIALLKGVTLFRFFKLSWQKIKKNFFISYMPKAKDADGMVAETENFAKRLLISKRGFAAKCGTELNLSCPNTGRTSEAFQTLFHTSTRMIRPLRWLNGPVTVKVNLTTPIEFLMDLEDIIDGAVISNTMPSFQQPVIGHIDWKVIFPDLISPLRKRGLDKDGGYAGPELTKLNAEYIKALRAAGFKKPIIAGSIYKADDVDLMVEAGASACAIGSMNIHRWWRRASIKRRVFNADFKEYDMAA